MRSPFIFSYSLAVSAMAALRSATSATLSGTASTATTATAASTTATGTALASGAAWTTATVLRRAVGAARIAVCAVEVRLFAFSHKVAFFRIKVVTTFNGDGAFIGGRLPVLRRLAFLMPRSAVSTVTTAIAVTTVAAGGFRRWQAELLALFTKNCLA